MLHRPGRPDGAWRGRSAAIIVVPLLAVMVVLTLVLLPPTPTAGATELGVYEGPGCDGRARIPVFEQWSGRRVQRTVDALDRRDWVHLEASARWIAQCWHGTGIALTLSVPMFPEDNSSSLKNGVAGAYDKHFSDIGRDLVVNGFPDATIRIGWEANGAWMAWTGARNPHDYVLDWRRIVSVLRQTPGQHFKFEWCPNIGTHDVPPDQLYPGDDVVDLIGLDVYDDIWDPALANPEVRWMYFINEPFGLRWHYDFARAHHKPTTFPEWGTGTRPDGHGAGDDPRFVTGMMDWFARTRPAYESYWDFPAPDYDARLSNGHFPRAAAAFRNALKSAPAADASRP